MTFFHLDNLRFSRVLRTRDRLVRSGHHFIHSLLDESPHCTGLGSSFGVGLTFSKGRTQTERNWSGFPWS